LIFLRRGRLEGAWPVVGAESRPGREGGRAVHSAPELLADIERARSLLVENDPEERARALTAAATREE
jgi:hypothetical protein